MNFFALHARRPLVLRRATQSAFVCAALLLPAALSHSPVSSPAHAQLFGGGGADAEKIVVKAQNKLKHGGRLSAVGQFAEAMKTYQSAASELKAAIEADAKVSDERTGKENDGPSGDELSSLLDKRIDDLKDLTGGGASPEEATHDVWEKYENVKRDFGDGQGASPADWEELARFTCVGSARLEAAFAKQGALKSGVIPNQGRVETKAALCSPISRTLSRRPTSALRRAAPRIWARARRWQPEPSRASRSATRWRAGWSRRPSRASFWPEPAPKRTRP